MGIPKFVVTTAAFVAVAVAVGFLAPGEGFDWWLTVGLIALAVGGEGLRTWIRSGRAKRRPSAGA